MNLFIPLVFQILKYLKINYVAKDERKVIFFDNRLNKLKVIYVK